jgi:hypothetical protein
MGAAWRTYTWKKGAKVAKEPRAPRKREIEEFLGALGSLAVWAQILILPQRNRVYVAQ